MFDQGIVFAEPRLDFESGRLQAQFLGRFADQAAPDIEMDRRQGSTKFDRELILSRQDEQPAGLDHAIDLVFAQPALHAHWPIAVDNDQVVVDGRERVLVRTLVLHRDV